MPSQNVEKQSQNVENVPVLWNAKIIAQVTGRSKTSNWRRMKKGLFPKPIRVARNQSLTPSNEVLAVNRAEIAEKSEEEIRQLVAELHAARKN